jgi:hypothetical protein
LNCEATLEHPGAQAAAQPQLWIHIHNFFLRNLPVHNFFRGNFPIHNFFLENVPNPQLFPLLFRTCGCMFLPVLREPSWKTFSEDLLGRPSLKTFGEDLR